MADPPLSEEMRITWENRLLRRLPHSPVLIALAIALPLAVFYVTAQLLLGYPIESKVIVVAAFIGYASAVNVYLTDRIERDVGFLEGVSVDEKPTFFMMVPSEMIGPSRIAGVAGLLLGIGVIEAITWGNGESPGAAWREFGSGSVAIPILLLLTWLMGRYAYFSLAFSPSWTDLENASIDLLDPTPLYARGRIGLRVAFVWIVGVSIGGLFFIGDSPWVVIPVVAAGFLVGSAALVVPVRGIHRQVRERKREELERVRAQLRRARDETLAGHGRDGGRLADLIAYEAKIESVSEWPFDVPTLRRFGLYLMIPLGSMVGGALVERVVDALFDR